ncbi:MAG: quinone oxidoreductase family protein [Acidimicrobiales bacterium]
MDSRVRAARLHRQGEPLQVEQVSLPSPAEGEVVVDLSFGGVNPVDRYVAAGRVAPDGPLPRTLGSEAAGHRDGRPVLVCGHGLGRSRDGVWAERAVVPEASVVDVPDGVDLAQAAAMGVVGVTAWRTTVDLAQVGPDDRVLVLGASGGVGGVILSLARSLGATVWGQTGSPAKAGWVADHGAHEVVVADAGQLLDQVRALSPTVVLDPLGGGFTGAGLEALEPFGRLVSFGTSAGAEASLNMQTLYRKSITVFGFGGLIEPPDRLRAGLVASLGALADGRLRVPVQDVVPLQEVEDAFRRLEARTVTGKLVLDLRS